jgi:2-dehydropantoate 2-reductase
MKICFFGIGGVGGYFGTLITEKFKGQHEIYFIARGKHKKAVCIDGLTLKKSGGEEVINVKPDKCTDSVDDLPLCDVIVLSVKSYDLDNAVKAISGLTHVETIILPLLNGVDIYDRIRKHLKKGIVLPSCVYVGTHIESPGVIYQKGGSCKILFGPDPDRPDENLESLKTLFIAANIDMEQQEKIDVSIWSKFIFIAAYGLITATYRKTLGEVLNDPDLGAKTKAIMGEINTLAAILNIPLDKNIVENSFLKAREFPYEAKTSFQRDVELKGRINEGDLFGGTLIRLSEKCHVPVPTTRKVYDKFLNS